MFPRAIILPTYEQVKALRQLPVHCQDEMWRHFITTVLEEIVDSVRNYADHSYRIPQLLQEVEKGRYRNYFNQNSLLTVHVSAVVWQVTEQLINSRIYDPDGILRYYYYPVNDPNFNDMLLIREPALPAPIGSL